jgi:hypothetical protein
LFNGDRKDASLVPFDEPNFADVVEVDDDDDDDDEHPKDSVIVKLDAPFPPVSVRYPSLIATVYSPASAFEDAAEEIGMVIVHEFLPFVSSVRH